MSVVDDIVDDILDAEYKRQLRLRQIRSHCQHCKRIMLALPYENPICKRCAKLAGYTAEERLMRAIYGKSNPCNRCNS